MTGVYLVECERCGSKWRFAESAPDNWYRMPDGYEILMNMVPVWCFKCNKFTEAENLVDTAIIKEALQRADDEASCLRYIRNRYGKADYRISSWLGRVRTADTASKDIPFAKRLKIQLAWRQARQSPAKCRKCGGSEFDSGIPQEDDDPIFLHQGCGGTCRLGIDGFAFIDRWYYYTAEGDAINE